MRENAKTDAKIREDIEVFDLVGEWGAWAVVIGVAAEFVYAAIFRGGQSFWHQWTPAIADGFIAFGIIVEIFFNRLSGARRDELDRRSNEKVAIANARADDVRLETERIKSQFGWRTLNGIQMERLLEGLSQMPASVIFMYVAGDAESAMFVSQIRLAFLHAKWQIQHQAAFFTELHFGVRIQSGFPFVDQSPVAMPAAEIVRMAFKEADIPFDDMPIPDWESASTWEDKGSSGVLPKVHIFGAPAAIVYVGPKVLPWAPDGVVARTQSAKATTAGK